VLIQYTHMCKMRSVETSPGMGGGGMIYLIYCKNYCKCRTYPQQNNKKYSRKAGTKMILMSSKTFHLWPRWHSRNWIYSHS
jgi:hypothetical protein